MSEPRSHAPRSNPPAPHTNRTLARLLREGRVVIRREDLPWLFQGRAVEFHRTAVHVEGKTVGTWDMGTHVFTPNPRGLMWLGALWSSELQKLPDIRDQKAKTPA